MYFLKVIGILYLAVSIFTCSMPRCAYIESAMNLLKSDNSMMNCHSTTDEPSSPKVPVLENRSGCECKLIHFVMAMPVDVPISSFVVQTFSEMIDNFSFLNNVRLLFFDVMTPPPRH